MPQSKEEGKKIFFILAKFQKKVSKKVSKKRLLNENKIFYFSKVSKKVSKKRLLSEKKTFYFSEVSKKKRLLKQNKQEPRWTSYFSIILRFCAAKNFSNSICFNFFSSQKNNKKLFLRRFSKWNFARDAIFSQFFIFEFKFCAWFNFFINFLLFQTEKCRKIFKFYSKFTVLSLLLKFRFKSEFSFKFINFIKLIKSFLINSTKFISSFIIPYQFIHYPLSVQFIHYSLSVPCYSFSSIKSLKPLKKRIKKYKFHLLKHLKHQKKIPLRKWKIDHKKRRKRQVVEKHIKRAFMSFHWATNSFHSKIAL